MFSNLEFLLSSFVFSEIERYDVFRLNLMTVYVFIGEVRKNTYSYRYKAPDRYGHL